MSDQSSTANKQRCRCRVGWRCVEWPTSEDGLCDYCRDECQRPVENGSEASQ